MVIKVSLLTKPEEMLMAEEVQIDAWGMSERMVTPKDIMIAIQSNGGIVLGAFDGERMVGFSVSFPGFKHGKLYLYSHQTGVIKDYQSRGVGYLLKQEQRKLALAAGMDLVVWTFDPLIVRNLYFNLNKLGGVARNYLIDYYGPMADSINTGWPTDRVLAEWFIDSVFDNTRKPPMNTEPFRPIVKKGPPPFERCVDWSIDTSVEAVLVDLPIDIVRLKESNREEALRWREASREVYRGYFSRGFAAVSVLRDGPACLLLKAKLPSNLFASFA
jgi:chorismate synthase